MAKKVFAERGNGIVLTYEPSYQVVDVDAWSDDRFSMRPYLPAPFGFPDLNYSDFVQRLRTLPIDRSHIVEEAYRPDLVSWKEFGTTKLWWMIMAYNGLSISDLKRGVKLSIFRMGDLESLLYDLMQEANLRRDQG